MSATPEPGGSADVIAVARAHVDRCRYVLPNGETRDGSCVFHQDNDTYYRVSQLLDILDQCQRDAAAARAEAERREVAEQNIISIIEATQHLVPEGEGRELVAHVKQIVADLAAARAERDAWRSDHEGLSDDLARLQQQLAAVEAARARMAADGAFTDAQIDAGIQAVESLRIMRAIFTPEQKRERFLRAARTAPSAGGTDG